MLHATDIVFNTSPLITIFFSENSGIIAPNKPSVSTILYGILEYIDVPVTTEINPTPSSVAKLARQIPASPVVPVFPPNI